MQVENFITVIIGINGTGKSTFCYKLIDPNQRALVVTSNGMPEIWRSYPVIDVKNREEMRSFTGIRQAFAMNYTKGQRSEILKHVHRNFSNGLLIMDDCKLYVKANLEHTPGLINLLGDFRHKCISMMFVLHTPTQVPPEVWGHARYAWVGKTSKLIKPSSFPTDNPEQFLEVQQTVNKLFEKAYAKQNKSHYGLFKRVKL